MKQTKKRTDYIDWDTYFMSLAKLSAMRSKDPNTQVGACVANKKNIVCSIGYNGLPRGLNDDSINWSRENNRKKDTKYPYIVHAENNAIINSGVKLENCTIFVTEFPCFECSKLIIQSGIKKVVYLSNKYETLEETEISRSILVKCKIKIIEFKDKHKLDEIFKNK